MGFEWPWIFLLAPLPVLLVYTRHKLTYQQTIDLPPSLAGALHQLTTTRTSHYQQIMRWLMLSIAWLSLLTAIAQPYINNAGTAQPASGRAMTLLIDLSTSMERRDFSIKDEAVDRLTVVKNIAGQFIADRRGDRIGLVLFGSEAFIASPLSFDLQAVDSALQSSGIGMAGRTTAIGDAMGLAIKSLREDPATQKAMVLLSDGTNNAGSVEPEDAASLAASLGIVVYTIGLGRDDSVNETQQFQSAAADLDEATLKSIAQKAGGKFFRAQTTRELQDIYTEIDTLESAQTQAPPLIIRRDYRNLFILIALIFVLLLTVRLPGRVSPV